MFLIKELPNKYLSLCFWMLIKTISGSDNILHPMEGFVYFHGNFVWMDFSEVLTCSFQMFCKYSVFKYFENMSLLNFLKLKIERKICYLKA